MTQECIETLKRYIQTSGNEDCGVLMGSQINDNIIRVNKVSGSIKVKEESSTYTCKIDKESANAFIKDDYEQSNHKRYYIGEWHTHPEDRPLPSSFDKSSIKLSFKENAMPINNVFLMVIVGRKEIYWGIYDGKTLKMIEPNLV